MLYYQRVGSYADSDLINMEVWCEYNNGSDILQPLLLDQTSCNS